MSRTEALTVLCIVIALLIEIHHVAMGWGFWDLDQVIHHETAIVAFVAFSGGLLTAEFIRN